MLGKVFTKLLPVIQRCRHTMEVSVANMVKREYGKSFSLCNKTKDTSLVHKELQEIFKFRDTKISNWIIEVFVADYISKLYNIKPKSILSLRTI